MTQQDISVIIPTHNRADAVHMKVQELLTEIRVGEIIVVVDGSTDSTRARLDSIGDPRLKLIVNEKATGPSRARNAGIRHARYRWVALLDDDDHHSDGFLDALVDVAEKSKAGIVGAPWIHLGSGVSPQEGFADAPRDPGGPSLLSASIVPEEAWVESVWIVPNVLIERSLLTEVKFNEGYRGNFWREESDFFVSASRAGYKVVATNQAYSYQYEKPAGGINRSNRLAYEYWVVHNDIRFMMRHGSWLKREGHIQSVGGFLIASLAKRIRPRIMRMVRGIPIRTS